MTDSPKYVLKPAHPKPEIALKINWIAQQELLSKGRISPTGDTLATASWWQVPSAISLKSLPPIGILNLLCIDAIIIQNTKPITNFFQKYGDQTRWYLSIFLFDKDSISIFLAVAICSIIDDFDLSKWSTTSPPRRRITLEYSVQAEWHDCRHGRKLLQNDGVWMIANDWTTPVPVSAKTLNKNTSINVISMFSCMVWCCRRGRGVGITFMKGTLPINVVTLTNVTCTHVQ